MLTDQVYPEEDDNASQHLSRCQCIGTGYDGYQGCQNGLQINVGPDQAGVGIAQRGDVEQVGKEGPDPEADKDSDDEAPKASATKEEPTKEDTGEGEQSACKTANSSSVRVEAI